MVKLHDEMLAAHLDLKNFDYNLEKLFIPEEHKNHMKNFRLLLHS